MDLFILWAFYWAIIFGLTDYFFTKKHNSDLSKLNAEKEALFMQFDEKVNELMDELNNQLFNEDLTLNDTKWVTE